MEKLKFLVDIGVGKKVEKWLDENNYDSKSVRSFNPKAKDVEILDIAVLENRMVITMDKDFGELVFNSGKTHSGALILRTEDATGDEKADVIKKILADYSDKLYGKFCVFQDGKLRVRE